MSAYFCELHSETLLHVVGPDAATFLQGQLSCDVRQVDDNHARPGVYCNPQGRVLCDFLLLKLAPDHFALRLRSDILQPSATTLARYVVFSKAKLAPESGTWTLIACWGEVSELLAVLLGELPPALFGVISGAGFHLVQLDDNGAQFELYIDRAQQPGLLAELATLAQAGSEQDWRGLQIERGSGRIEASTIGEFLPQMLNYDLTGHVNFNKGCYTGQEVIARLHYRGQSKRRMYLAQLPITEGATAGAPLYTSASSQSAGTIVNAVVTATGTTSALIVASVAALDQGLHVLTADGPRLQIRDLPASASPAQLP